MQIVHNATVVSIVAVQNQWQQPRSTKQQHHQQLQWRRRVTDTGKQSLTSVVTAHHKSQRAQA